MMAAFGHRNPKHRTQGCAIIHQVAARPKRGSTVSNDPSNDPEEPIPFMQKLLDNPFLLLFLGVLIPMVVYVLWGVIDILTIPPAP